MKYQIVVVEDDPASQELMIRNLERLEDVTVEGISDGKAALKRVETDPPHLVLLDVNLPGISGIDLIKHFRGRLSLSAMKIVVLTANTIASHNPVAKLADELLEKPINNRIIREKCKKHLEELDLEQYLIEREAREERNAIDEMFSDRD